MQIVTKSGAVCSTAISGWIETAHTRPGASRFLLSWRQREQLVGLDRVWLFLRYFEGSWIYSS